MKIEYIRNLQSGYMRIEMQEPLNKIEEEMLMRNKIEGLLPVLWQKEDEKYLLRYDITGKQGLDLLLEDTLVDEKLIRSLLVGIYVVVRELEKYLLCPDGILLLPESIFFETKSQTMHFCYYPEAKETLQARFVRLMEYVLAKTDHKNIEAVRLVYGVYEEAQKNTFALSLLQEHLLEQKMQEIVFEENVESENVCEADKGQNNVSEDRREIREEKRGIQYVIQNILGWINKSLKGRFRKNMPISQVAFELESDCDDWMETKVLNAMEDTVKGILKYEGTNMLPDVVVSKVPFTIGSAKDCDGCINYPTISRYHARISVIDGVYFLEDLNSTNGTKVNGGLLSYKTRVSIKKQEMIYFANEPYRFL